MDEEDVNAIRAHRFPLSNYIDGLKWIPPFSALDRFAVFALFNSDSGNASVDLFSITRTNQPHPIHRSSWVSPSRLSSISPSQDRGKPLIAVSTVLGSFHALSYDPLDASLHCQASLSCEVLHDGRITCIDFHGIESGCITAGEDGRIKVVRVGDSVLNPQLIFDSEGLVFYNCVKWASSVEFATGGMGFGLQWWDVRKPGGSVLDLNGTWCSRPASGAIHSIDIHPSRKHSCLAGGSLGTVFAWDMRWPQEPVSLSSSGNGKSAIESEVWKVQYDPHTFISQEGRNEPPPVSGVLPAMVCSEDGILSVVCEGDNSVGLLAEPCAVNSFDIDMQNPSDVLCSLEWESVALVTRE